MNAGEIFGRAKRALCLAILDDSSGERFPDLGQLGQFRPRRLVNVDRKAYGSNIRHVPLDQAVGTAVVPSPT